jgi:5-methylcytosine-specific restriction endonuclease McrA
MSAGEYGRLEEQLKRSPIFSPECQPQPEVSLHHQRGTISRWSHCCPEITFDCYGAFSSSGSFIDSEDRRMRDSELKKQNALPDDWRWQYNSLQPSHFSDCREYSILSRAVMPSKQHGKRSDARNIPLKKKWEVFVRDNFTCQYCGRKPSAVALTVDHVVSVHDGGSNDMGNLKTSCEDCNRGKSDSSLPERRQ